jgi:hypothetical protein
MVAPNPLYGPQMNLVAINTPNPTATHCIFHRLGCANLPCLSSTTADGGSQPAVWATDEPGGHQHTNSHNNTLHLSLLRSCQPAVVWFQLLQMVAPTPLHGPQINLVAINISDPALNTIIFPY